MFDFENYETNPAYNSGNDKDDKNESEKKTSNERDEVNSIENIKIGYSSAGMGG